MTINSAAKTILTAIAQNENLYWTISDILSWDGKKNNAGYSIEDLREFLRYGNINNSNIVEGVSLSAGSTILNFDIDDSFSTMAMDRVLSIWVIESYIPYFIQTYREYSNRVSQISGGTIVNISSPPEGGFNASNPIDRIGKNIFIEIVNDFLSNEYPFTTNDEVLLDFALVALSRVELWRSSYEDNNNSINYTLILNEENRSISETTVSNDPNDTIVSDESGQIAGLNNLIGIAKKFYASYETVGERNVSSRLVDLASANKVGEFDANSFYRVFQTVNAAVLEDPNSGGLSNANVKNLISKMEEVGLLKLASYAGEIASFGKKRTANMASIKKSASEAISETGDVPWLLLLNEVITILKRDSLFFASLSYYFPSLVTFVFDALALVGDYSNDGKGGGQEDVVNNEEYFLDTLERAFGVGADGKASFTLAFRAMQTAKRIEEVLKKSPFRPNVSPKNPDIFHLRIGAANFYVPPVSIDVNSSFKAGSMMPGAIRQKNSPKFNSGYRETTIRMRLFFPNYEEIWGILIDNASTLKLNEDFKIDFKMNGDSEDKIDKFLSSLRGLIAAFKYSPILPVKNHYLNAVHGITAVGLANMTIATIPNFPFALSVDLELLNYNHKPFLPMISDFNQAIHWGKYRQYMGKAAGQLSQYVNEEFLLKTSDVKELDQSGQIAVESPNLSPNQVVWDGFEYRPVAALGEGDTQYVPPLPQASDTNYDVISGTLTTNIIDQWKDGNHLTLFAPAESQTKLFLPSTSSFRTEQEKMFTDLGQSAWEGLLNSIGIDIDQSASYGISLAETIDISQNNSYSKSINKIILDEINLITAGINSQSMEDKSYDFLIANFIGENNLTDEEKEWLKNKDSDTTQYPQTKLYRFQGKFIDSTSLNSIKRGFKAISNNPKEYLNYLVDKQYNDQYYRNGKYPDKDTIKGEVSRAFNVAIYQRFFQSGPIQSLMEAARARSGAFQFNEWEVPMIRMDLDPEAVIINGVTVTLANNLVKLQVQMQDEPTYQHIGGKDSFINISMTVIGEKELIKFRSLFDHISGLARLEHASGVIGFLGIKNIITALAGIKYVMPLTYNVSTKPNYPHVYDVELTLIDFDIFQQKREELSSRQQAELVEEFGTKKNPFLRIKQLWGSFNAYPDFPLFIKNDSGETVGCLDPDFYFRSFEMFDNDVINNITDQTPKIQDYYFEDPSLSGMDGMDGPTRAARESLISNKILDFLRLYNIDSKDSVTLSKNTDVLDQMVDYLKTENISKKDFIRIFYKIINAEDTRSNKDKELKLLTDFISLDPSNDENDPFFMTEVHSSSYQVGDISPNDYAMLSSIEAALEGKYNQEIYDSSEHVVATEDEVSFHPDEVDFHKQIFMIPAADPKNESPNRIPAIMQTALGTHFGYIDKITGRFYLTVAGDNVTKGSSTSAYKIKANLVEDTQTPDKGTTLSTTGVAGVTPLPGYQKPHNKNSYSHWETMLIDTRYRDISGRMIRAFPTYMLWLIDEGGYFAGVKMFDNFYGLQSIIDFSVVSSEDLLGDTLIFRLSNLYSKLTKKESSAIFSTDGNAMNGDSLSLSEGLQGIVERAINMSRNVLSGLRNEYIVDIANIRLKPGVRVHLRGGYGANPNSLQTLFNGVITNVEQGEIVTVTAQSDAIELGAVINSTKQKGDSGKIDGGIDTGMYMSEPRDLMVRLLSMGSSRTREAFAHATRGTIFSENKFGIKHFGNILYEPLNPDEAQKNAAIRESVSAAFVFAGGGESVPNGFSSNVRGDVLPLIGQLWANFSAQTDLEIFKRNIYAGNGLGIAQFMGGDIDDGWSTASSLVPDETYNDRTEGYLGRLTDITYNKLMEKYQQNDDSAKDAIDSLTASNRLISSQGRGGPIKGAIGLGLAGVAAALAGPAVGVVAGVGLLGVLSGRGGTNIFKTMGILAPNEDDDLPGFDEVSFRAQTYMRTVWDMFQICARLLPNYIVAVRPFEDRSTVFYGKPHWLYTSGVVPVTTGFSSEEKARKDGTSSGPKTLGPDQVLNTILETINKDSNPLADYAKFFQSFEPNESFQTVSKAITESTGIYSPTNFFNGRLINFYSPQAYQYFDLVSGAKISARLPVSKGMVGIGPHLPIITRDMKNQNSGAFITEATFDSQRGLHRQIGNLPPRYGFPFFTVTEKYKLENSSTVHLRQSWVINQEGVDSNSYHGLDDVIKMELDLFNKTKFSLMPSVGADTEGTINFDTPLDFSPFYDQIEGTIKIEDQKMIMPLPQIGLSSAGGVSGNISVDQINASPDSFSFEYQIGNYGELTYREWGAPETPEDEQFYIAMKWPYTPSGEVDDATLDKFKTEYGFTSLYGTAEDYKKRKVLVYNPNNGRAVVCKPAYFMWGKENLTSDIQAIIPNSDANLIDGNELSALVSPDAAYYLSIITYSSTEAKKILENHDATLNASNFPMFQSGEATLNTGNPRIATIMFAELDSGYRTAPMPQECLFAFIPDDIPVGVISTSILPINKFKLENAATEDSLDALEESEDRYIVGFGNFAINSGEELLAREIGSKSDGLDVINAIGKSNSAFDWYAPANSEFQATIDALAFGGNALNIKDGKSYFQLAIDKDTAPLTSEELKKRREAGDVRTSFAAVYNPADIVSIQARSYFDENFDSTVSVIAGNGRTYDEAQDIWDYFRAEYHNYESVKRIFFDVYGLDPDLEEEFPPEFSNIISGKDINDPFKYFGASNEGAQDEFSILFGSDYGGGGNSSSSNPAKDYSNAIEFMRKNYIDAPLDEGGLLAYFNNIISKNLAKIYESFFAGESVLSVLHFNIEASNKDGGDTTIDVSAILQKSIKTPKQLFLLIVGLFRQRLWEDPYARAWLVLKPDKKPGWFSEDDGWSFKPVDKVFRAYIDPNSDYAKPSKKAKFLQLLVSTRGEGNSSNTYFSEVVSDVSEFASRTIGPIVSAVGDALSGLISMFKTSMQQLGYALSEVGNFKKQANILNKALNDSIYYSLGRPGTLLRAVDNPFTREYGEPVIEIREPFQRIHYISSFSHILSNQIQENLNNVATQITAVSDGKYPVTVALDKGAPAERQVEKTVETGLYFDNIVGSGFTGFLHPLMHPLETFRGVAKTIQGAPDELSARRVALSHLKESIKDIYGGELLIIGNGDVRPHDLVYLSDVYERMYGIFEVEQVIHHFTPELGFITSITPNALVTVNDPARWFMTSWMHSWMHVQNIRNDARVYIDNIRNANSGLSFGGNISIDRLGEILTTQIVGGFQFTHGSSALIKDIMANQTAMSAPGVNSSLLNSSAQEAGGVPTFALMAQILPGFGQLVWKGWKWIRDNVLDQHGCYVQYLNKNGQPMDAGLSYNQGMVVGQHHSKALLPGILGTRVKARTPEGNSFIRSDDLFKSLGWNEVAINDIYRHISYESALVHAQVLKLSGLGPEKAGFEWQFRVICKVDRVLDGDTFDVTDVISGASFRVRFDGINAAETNVMEGKVDYPDTTNPTNLSFLDISTPGGKAKIYVKKVLENKLIVLRINQTRTEGTNSVGGKAVLEQDFEAGSKLNTVENYQLDIFGSGDRESGSDVTGSRVMGTVFYYLPQEKIDIIVSYISNLFRSNIASLDTIKDKLKNDIYDKSAFFTKFDSIFESIESLIGDEYYNIQNTADILINLTDDQKKLYSRSIYFKVLEQIYDKASDWPRVSWDEYFSDGYPVTLNWELVVNNLAKVFVKDLQKESFSVINSNDALPMPTSVSN